MTNLHPLRRALSRLGRRGQRGVSMTETLIALPVVIFFASAVVQLGLIYRTKITLEYAAHEAARAGALNNGQILPISLRGFTTVAAVGTVAMEGLTNAMTRGSVWQGLTNAMMPLYVTEASTGGLFRGWAKANGDLLESACIEYLNPTQQTFLDWGFIENFGENRWMMQIPNDTLRYRKPLAYDYKAKANTVVGADPMNPPIAAPPDSELRGRISNKTLGETNVLHLRVHYGYELNVPIMGYLFMQLYKTLWTGEMNQLDKYYVSQNKLPLKAEGVVGMQSPLQWHPFYSFGPATDNSIDMQPFYSAWEANDETALERPQDVVTGIFGFIRNNAGNLVVQGLGSGVDAAAAKIGSGNAFCPAIWQAGVKDPIRMISSGLPGGGQQ